MAMDITQRRQMLDYVNMKEGVVDRRIFYDLDIYQLEMEQIFARCWLFMCHESQIPNPGDFFLNFMGEDRVIVVRNNEGGISVLVNSCRHRGNAVCRADEGHAMSFMCTYHGWTYDLKGALVGVPGFKEVYHEELDRESWGLINAMQVDSYKGFVFACMDAEAPGLYEYLGHTGRVGIDVLADQGNMVVVSGVEKYTMNANWKFPSDNTADFYHAQISHASAFQGGWSARRRGMTNRKQILRAAQRPGIAAIGDYGHVVGLGYMPEDWEEKAKDDPVEVWRTTPEAKERLGPLLTKVGNSKANIFPNLFIPGETRQVAIRMPKGPTKIELWYFTLVDANDPQEVQKESSWRSLHTFGASGMLEQDDGENWDQSTRGARGVVSSRYPLNYQMGLGRGEIINDESSPPHISHFVNESYHLWQYQAWAEMMAAGSWDEWKRTHSRAEGRM